jgi:flavodoxin
MKSLIVFYSRSGNTRKVAEKISKNLNADIDEIIDKTNRQGIKGWIFGGRDALKNNQTKIEYKKDPSKYRLVIIGTPIWAATVSPAIRTYLTDNKFPRVAFFCTCGGKSGKAFEEMEKLSKKPIATLELVDKKLGEEFCEEKIKKFCKELHH